MPIEEADSHCEVVSRIESGEVGDGCRVKARFECADHETNTDKRVPTMYECVCECEKSPSDLRCASECPPHKGGGWLAMMIVIQCFAPSHLPIAAEGGCSNTKVIKNSETARLRSSGVAPISVVKPFYMVMIDVPDQQGEIQHTLRLRISNIRSI